MAEHKHSCACGHDHGAEHKHSCACGHDHGAEHKHSCACGHDHDHEEHGKPNCPCGHDALTEGTGHDRGMGKLFFALGGGLLTLNSFILEYLLPSQTYAVQLSALCGAVVLALPIVITAV